MTASYRHLILLALGGACAMACGCAGSGGTDAPAPAKLPDEKELVKELRTLIDGFEEGDRDGRLKIMYWCEKKGLEGDRSVDLLLSMLRDREMRGRSYVTRALAEIGDKRAVEPLIERLQDEDEHPWLRWEFARALGKLGDKRAVEPLLKLLTHDKWQLRHSCSCALGWLADERAFEPLVKMLGDQIWEVRKETCEALQDFGDKRGIAPLKKLLESETEEPVIAAAKKAIAVLEEKKE